ncbi:MAG TPA: glycoside hydrolase family 3 N-terminal domain-containing protein [Polyangiaceae bacterium]|nr:glycoside hydrolase family 3 N-terminal domain-containing protein [Polyangiaceae bacterium]
MTVDPLDHGNPELPADERTELLLARMTLAEKIGQMCMFVGEPAEVNGDNVDEMTSYRLGVADQAELVRAGRAGAFLKVPGAKEAAHLQSFTRESRLRIPLLIATDAIHGHGMDVEAATIFPSPIGLAASFDSELVERVAACTARELRATGFHWTFSPNVDVVRDPRWGRTGESFGEDPFLVAELGVAMVRGYQGRTLGNASVLACAKHLVAGGCPENGLNGAPAEVSERTLREAYLPPFERAVRAGVSTLMPAHNEVNGVPCHASRELLNDLLRESWGFTGFVVSDWNDIPRLHSVHRVAENEREASYLAVRAGIDMQMHGGDFFEHVSELVREGKLSETRIDEAVRPILRAKFALGLFDPADAETKLPEASLLTAEHRELAREASRKSLVLLKNRDNLLPLGAARSLLVTGPNAHDQSLLGDWSRRQPEANVVTILQGLRALAAPHVNIVHSPIGSITAITDEEIAAAVRAAEDCDVLIAAVGENSLRDNPERSSGENVDRASLDLPGRQLELLQALAEAGKPLVVLLVSGAPICSEWLVEHANALVQAWEPGIEGGTALAEVLFGLQNPSGKLPITFPRSTGQLKTYAAQRPSSFHRGRFRFSTHEPLFPFGHGLSYTTFEYRSLRSKDSLAIGEPLQLELELENTGVRAGEEIVLIFLLDSYASVTRPAQELVAFERVQLAAGERRTIRVELASNVFSLLDAKFERVCEPGEFKLVAGLGKLSKNVVLVA